MQLVFLHQLKKKRDRGLGGRPKQEEGGVSLLPQ